jgi:hypothetical protein
MAGSDDMTSRTRRAVLASIALVWGGLLAASVCAMVAHETTRRDERDARALTDRKPAAARLVPGDVVQSTQMYLCAQWSSAFGMISPGDGQFTLPPTGGGRVTGQLTGIE